MAKSGDLQSSARYFGLRSTFLLVAAASTALLLGLLVYLLDRPPGSAQLIRFELAFAPTGYAVFGGLGSNLPSALHVYAFILMTMVAVRPSSAAIFGVAIGWLALEMVLEAAQHPVVSGLLAEYPVVHGFLGTGTFDPLDLVALGLGAVSAFATVWFAARRERQCPDKALTENC